ncbi:MAG: undecaprenyl-diphosphate phosphatase [Bacillota bacterium]
MDVLKAIVLGAVQGLTEFLPVSSSGHLAIAREILKAPEALVTFDVLVHLGTLVAVVVAFRKDVGSLVAAATGIVEDVVRRTSLVPTLSRNEHRRLVLLIVLASVPTAIMGAALEPAVRGLFASRLAVGIFLVATGTVLWLAERASEGRVRLRELGAVSAFCIGVAQGLAIAPGFSRSGVTISAGRFFGLRRDDAARFSFLLSIPVILGAGVFELPDLIRMGISRGFAAPFIAGALASVVSGYVAIHLVFSAIRKRRFKVFAVYTWLVGLAVIIWTAVGS